MANFRVSDSTISIGQSVIFTDASTGIINSWLWEFERGVPATYNGQAPPPIQYNVLGAYDVTLTVSNNAGQRKRYKPGFIQVGPTGISEVPVRTEFSIIPNPTFNGKFSIVFSTVSSHEVSVFSSVGALIRNQTTDSKEIVFNLSEIPKGLYFIQVNNINTGAKNTQKLIIQ